MKPNLLITNDHQDITGGGTYIMMILYILQNHYNLYADKNIEYYSDEFTPWRLNVGDINLIDSNIVPDIHLYASYGGWTEPKGKQNIQITYFPVNKRIDGWDYHFGLNNFVIDNIKTAWGVNGAVVEAYCDPNAYWIGEKTNTVINIGQYFYETDDHSKNQHKIIEWFQKQNQVERLICHGVINNVDYFQRLVNMVNGDPRIQLKSNCTQQEIRQDLADSKYMLHAIGWHRNNPAQTEHFGIVAVEALMAGCQPIVHNSGGCKDIPGVLVYNEFDEIDLLKSQDPKTLRDYGLRFNIENTTQQLLKVLQWQTN